MIYLVGLVLIVLVGLLSSLYLSNAFSKFRAIRSLSGERKWLGRLIGFGLLAGGFALFTWLLSVLDAAIILLHLLFAFLLYGLVFRIFRRKTGEQPKRNWQGWLALLTAGVYLLIGYFQCMHVWKTEYALSTEKAVGELRIALLADSHLGTTFYGEGFAAYLEEILQEKPDLIAISGDFVDDDTRRRDMQLACEALGKAETPYGVWFAYGNHDKGYFNSRDFSAEELARTMEENGIHILEDETAELGGICLVGRRDASSGPRKELSALLEGVGTDRYVIVLDHEPTDFEKEAATDADLVLCGHTHGGQMIPLGLVGQWFGNNDREYGYETRNGTEFIVTSGISDWALHFKTGTRSEYVMITVTGSR